jgi:hypothetical protein
MCRRKIYFKGMNNIVNAWETERIHKKNEEAFNQAFDCIFDEDEDEDEQEFNTGSDYESDTMSDTDSWETCDGDEQITSPFVLNAEKDYYSEFILGEIMHLQKEYQKAVEIGVDFDWYLDNFDYIYIEQQNTTIIEDDVFPHTKNLFVSNHKNLIRNKRSGKRISIKMDTITFTVTVVF